LTEYVVRQVVRDVIAEVAVNELLIVDGLGLHDDGAVVRRMRRNGGRDEQLGFGVDEIAALTTPVVWLALDEMARRVGESAADGGMNAVKALSRKLFHTRPKRVTLPSLTGEQYGLLRILIEETASERGVEADRAKIIADAVLARMAVGTPEAEDTSGDADAAPE
jgi:hypothetical protein